MPTLIGWAGATASIERQAWFLFTILFLWQFPHFLAIALMYREDYARAGFRMLPQFDADGHHSCAGAYDDAAPGKPGVEQSTRYVCSLPQHSSYITLLTWLGLPR